MQQSINDILKTIDDAINSFQDKIPGLQKVMYEELLPIIKELKIKNGFILNNLENLKLILSLKIKLQKIIVNKDYKTAVEKFIESFNLVGILNINYFRQFNEKFTPSETLPIVKKLAIESTINDLVGQGLNVNVIDPIREILRQNITTGGSYATFTEILRNHIITNDTGEGSLERYTNGITIDSINQYSRQYHSIIAQDLNFNWGRYVGSLLTTSREFCVFLTKKEWVHKSELPEILKGHIDGHNCKLSKSTGLPIGMKPETNVNNFEILVGGYTCGHKWMMVPDSAVPVQIRKRIKP